MNLVIADEAKTALKNQIRYVADHGAPIAARKLGQRFYRYIETSLTATPRNGRFLTNRDLWETWIPKTKFIIWYIFDDETLTIVDLWHTSQDRTQTN